jgi:hypothetical protein
VSKIIRKVHDPNVERMGEKRNAYMIYRIGGKARRKKTIMKNKT